MDNTTRISSAAVSDRGLSEKRPQNEDSFLEMGKSGIFAVADGVGGAQAGEVASQMAMEILGEAFANFAIGADAAEVMRTAIERANAAIHQMARELPQLANMATTIVALHLADEVATIGHVGDSRLYRVDRDGTLYRETDDHSMVGEEVRAGRMTEEQAETHPSRNIISRALGAEPSVEVDIKTIMVESGNSFLICSDGITRHVQDAEIKGVLTFGGDPVDICEYLKGLCYERGAEDNLTAVVVKVLGNAIITEPPPRAFTHEEDTPTVATARSPFESKAHVEDDLDLLELETETQELTMPAAMEEKASEPVAETVPQPESVAAAEPVQTSPVADEDHNAKTIQSDAFTMFGGSGEAEPEEVKSNSIGRILSAFAFVVLGSIIGLGVYHFALAPKTEDIQAPAPQVSEMKSDNVAINSFEKLRRNVDQDPAAYLKETPPPNDAADYYLRGRAYILTGDFANARIALIEAQSRLGSVDKVNAQVLASDIAIGMAVTSDATVQTNLKKEFEAVKSPANANTNTKAIR